MLCIVSYLPCNNIVKAYGRGSSIDSWRSNFVIDWIENRFREFDGLFFTACFVQLASSNLYFHTLDGHFGILSIYTQKGGIFFRKILFSLNIWTRKCLLISNNFQVWKVQKIKRGITSTFSIIIKFYNILQVYFISQKSLDRLHAYQRQ